MEPRPNLLAYNEYWTLCYSDSGMLWCHVSCIVVMVCGIVWPKIAVLHRLSWGVTFTRVWATIYYTV